MKTLYLLLIGICFTNCVSTKKTTYNSIKKGVHFVLEDIYNFRETSIKYIIYDSIIFKKLNTIDENNKNNADTELAKLWQKALSEVLEENRKYDHSKNISECNVILQNPKSDSCHSRYFIEVRVQYDEYLKYQIQWNNSKFDFKRVEHYYEHVEGKKLIDPDSTIYAPMSTSDKIDSLPTKNIFKLKNKR